MQACLPSIELAGYARMDLRLTEKGEIYVIEANANPNIEFGEDFAESAESTGMSYERFCNASSTLDSTTKLHG